MLEGELAPELAGEVTPQVTEEIGTKLVLSRHQVEIMRNCLESKAITDLMTIAGRADRTKFRDQVLNPLLEEGLCVEKQLFDMAGLARNLARPIRESRSNAYRSCMTFAVSPARPMMRRISRSTASNSCRSSS